MESNYSPNISIIMPAFNAEKTIIEAIDSILIQTYIDFELIIINDGSYDETEKIILSYNNNKIKYLSNSTNKGLVYTLNKGISHAKGKYIVRMDSDDIMYPDRLKVQFEFMESNPQIVASGSFVTTFGTQKYIQKLPVTDLDIRCSLFYGSPIAHPSSIIRKKTLLQFKIEYKEEYIHAEDYKLWYDLSKVGKLHNINKCLLKYRLSSSQISTKHINIQNTTVKRIKKEIVSDFLSTYNINYPEKIDFNFLKTINKYYKDNKNKFAIIEKKKFASLISIIYLSLPNNISIYAYYILNSLSLPTIHYWKFKVAMFLKFTINKKFDYLSLE